jgi:hypothetical protein
MFKGRSGKGTIAKDESEEISPTKSADVFTTLADMPSGIDAEVAIKLKHFIIFVMLSFKISVFGQNYRLLKP